MATFADKIVAESLLNPDATHEWHFGVNRQGTRRAKALLKLMTAKGIKAELRRDDTYPPGLWKLSFLCRDYRRAEEISNACYVGESWWPTKGKGKATCSPS